MRKLAKANVTPIRQSTQFTCVSTSTCMALNALGVKCSEEEVNNVIGAKPMQGARWEEVLACAQYFGCRATLTTPATLTQVKGWTDQGKPVLIAWNPEGRDWSHASLIFDVTGERGNYIVHIADPNIPNPDKTTREVGEDDFYSKWFEKWPNYLVRRPALMLDREITPEGRQVVASVIQRVATRHIESKMFGLLPNHIGWQQLKRFEDQFQWMFKKGQHEVTSRIESSNEKSIFIEAKGSTVKISGFKQSDTGYTYRRVAVEIDGRVVKKTENLDEIKRIVHRHFSNLGLQET